MSQVYEIRVKSAALENLKACREQLRQQMGTSQVGVRLTGMSPTQAGELANTLLSLLDSIDSIVSRAKPAS